MGHDDTSAVSPADRTARLGHIDQWSHEASETFDDFVREHGTSSLRTAHLITRDAHLAHDAVQEAMTGLYRRWDSVRDSPTLTAYVRRSVVNAAIRLTTRQRRLRLLPDDTLARQASGADVATTAVNADLAWRLCADLPPTQRAAVVLRFYDDLSFAEIAEILHCREATARSHVHRALDRLRTLITES